MWNAISLVQDLNYISRFLVVTVSISYDDNDYTTDTSNKFMDQKVVIMALFIDHRVQRFFFN